MTTFGGQTDRRIPPAPFSFALSSELEATAAAAAFSAGPRWAWPLLSLGQARQWFLDRHPLVVAWSTVAGRVPPSTAGGAGAGSWPPSEIGPR